MRVLAIQSIGTEGLIVSANGAITMNATITVHDSAARFRFTPNLRRKTAPNRKARTNICGRVNAAAVSISHAPRGRFFSAGRTEPRMNNTLIVSVDPQIDMTSTTAGFNANRKAEVSAVGLLMNRFKIV